MIKDSFFLESYGCTSNKADSYIISNVLTESNYTNSTLENAQFIIINTCAVKEQTENKIKARLKALHDRFHNKPNKHIIIAGCLPHIAPDYINIIKNIIPSFAAIIDNRVFLNLPEIFQEIKSSKKNLIYLTEKPMNKAKYYINHQPGKITGIIPISEGCLGSCTYCCVKNARGKLICYNAQDIIQNIKHQLEQEIKEIYLTSQDCSTYEFNGAVLVDLVKKIVNLDYKFFLRIGMINPSFLIEDFDQLISIFNMDKVYQFLHIPIQSGSNKILKTMQRKYLISDIIDNLELLRKELPNLTISTDIICGFPGETEYDFYKTINFIKWLKPEILNISKFTPRPGTSAKKMEQLDNKIIKERSLRLSSVFRNSLKHMNDRWENWEGEILTLHEGTEKNQVFGRNSAYKNVFINNSDDEFGKFIKVKIEKVEGFNLFGKIID